MVMYKIMVDLRASFVRRDPLGNSIRFSPRNPAEYHSHMSHFNNRYIFSRAISVLHRLTSDTRRYSMERHLSGALG